jgi:hypothetical protein
MTSAKTFSIYCVWYFLGLRFSFPRRCAFWPSKINRWRRGELLALSLWLHANVNHLRLVPFIQSFCLFMIIMFLTVYYLWCASSWWKRSRNCKHNRFMPTMHSRAYFRWSSSMDIFSGPSIWRGDLFFHLPYNLQWNLQGAKIILERTLFW